jgi:hypothetical protein
METASGQRKGKGRKNGCCILLSALILAVALDLPAKGGIPTLCVPVKGEQMKSSEDIRHSILSIPEDRFFKDMEKLFLDLELKLADTGFMGVAVNAPGSISIGRTAQLPVIMALQQTGLRAWRYPRDNNCVVMAVETTTRAFYFGQIFRDLKAEAFSMPIDATPPPQPQGANAIARSSGVSYFDARPVLALPWRAGTYRLTVVNYDWVSNTVEVVLKGDDPIRPAAAPLVNPLPAAPGQNHRMPSYRVTEAVPVPADNKSPGAVLRMAPNPEPGIKLAAAGSFSIRADSFHICSAPFELTEVDGRQHRVGAVVPVTLAIFNAAWPAPLRFQWGVPVYSQAGVQPGERIEAGFAVDVLADSPLSLSPGEYAAYLVVEGYVFGPAPFIIP